jgi:uncharacterized protein (DUF2235 family)
MSKNIIICCDGTNNQLNGDLTNVVRLFQVAVKDGRQVAFYDPGVGTMAAPDAKSWAAKRWSLVEGLAFGAGLEENVFEAYRYLMATYEPGDRVFLSGFSRGAFTARVLAGMLHGVGLLEKGTDNLLPYLWTHYRGIRIPPADAPDSEKEAAARYAAETELLKSSFTRECPVAFLGPWDTVGSVGMYNANQSFPFTFENPSVAVVRHAVSMDEKRAAFRSNVFKADPTKLPGSDRPRVMNVWFAGVHADVGGGYPITTCGLAMIAFEWMVREAKAAGMLVNDESLKSVLAQSPPCATADAHESLAGAWKAMEYLPARRFDWTSRKTVWRYKPNKPREMRESPFLHRSVLQRMGANPEYRPASLPRGVDPASYPVDD